VKGSVLAIAALLLFSSLVYGEDLAVELRFESTPAEQQNQTLSSTVKSLRPVRIQPFTDNRAAGETFLGELKVNGLRQKVRSKTAVSVYAADAFRKVYDDWGGKTSLEAPLTLKGEITQFALEESDGYQARVSLHFFLKDEEGKVLWDGHSSGVVRGTGRTLTPESLVALFNGLLRETYTEMLEDEKLIGVWSGRVQNSYIIRDAAPPSQSARNDL